MKKEKIGSVYYDNKDKRWKCTYYILEAETQKEKRKYKSFITEPEAKEFLTNIQYQKGNNLFIQNNGIPLNKLMREINNQKLDANIITERTYKRNNETIQAIEKNEISHKNINDITSFEIQNYLNTLTYYSESTLKKIKEQFSQSFNEAINRNYLTKNPMNGIIRPKSTKLPKTIRALEIDEQQKLTNYLMNTPVTFEPYKVAYLIQMYLGLRLGEALALIISDINLQKNLISVNKTLSTDKNGKVIMKYMPKTSSGIREVPIPQFIINEIITQMKIAESNKDKQLFLTPDNNYVRPSNANRRLREILNNLGIYDISSHSLRHTYTTRCIEAGIKPVVLQRLLGHKDVSLTLNIYTTVNNRFKELEIEKVNNYYINNTLFPISNNSSLQLNNDYDK